MHEGVGPLRARKQSGEPLYQFRTVLAASGERPEQSDMVSRLDTCQESGSSVLDHVEAWKGHLSNPSVQGVAVVQAREKYV